MYESWLKKVEQIFSDFLLNAYITLTVCDCICVYMLERCVFVFSMKNQANKEHIHKKQEKAGINWKNFHDEM